MPLPGKLAIGFLQEDNPIKAYFRIQPQYVLEAEGFQKLENTQESYLEDGCIRIVPDKNELTHFKTRMRQLGRYCALDLRKHPGENEKIRPNKNFGGNSERNANIVYSDVIGAIPLGLAAEILDASYVFEGEEITLRCAPPATRFALTRREGKISGPWIWQESKDLSGCLTLRHAPGREFFARDEAELEGYLLTLTVDAGEQLCLLGNLLPFGVQPDEQEAPAPEEAAPAPEEARPAELKEGPAVPAAIEAAPEEARPEPRPLRAPLEKPVERAPEPLPEKPAEKAAEKPWMQRTEILRPRAISNRLSLRDQSLEAQVGFNPRKGRSLSEVVDEQWRRSRMDQLGHPVPATASGEPHLSPVDMAKMAIEEVWQIPDARASLLKSILDNREISETLRQKFVGGGDGEPKPDAYLTELESTRLKIMNEIDALRIRRSDMKTQLMEEMRQTHRQEFDKYKEQNQAILDEVRHNEQAAESARLAADAAGQLLGKSSEQLEQLILERLMTDRARELMLHMNDMSKAPAAHPQVYEPSAGQLISDLRVQLESAGIVLDNDGAVNLLACALTGGMAVVSGASGSGKSALIRQLAAALGLSGPSRRFVEARSPEEPAVRELLERCDKLTPSIVLFDDINLSENEDAVNGVIRLQEEARAKDLPLIILLTVQDAPEGRPLNLRLLTRAFLIRLDPASAASRWKPPTLLEPSPDRAVSLRALQEILTPRQELPCEVESRLNRLRGQLEKIGYSIDRRTLNELWLYCASVDKASRRKPLEILDWALAQRALPAMIAGMDLNQLEKLPLLFADMPVCMKLMDQPLPLPPL